MKSIVLAITEASGAAYAECFIKKVAAYPTINLTIVASDAAKETYADETGESLDDFTPRNQAKGMSKLFSRDSNSQDDAIVSIVSDEDFSIPYCSGSSAADVMVIMPCNMGTAAEIAAGITSSVTAKIAEVQLKEKKRLIIVPRESPLSLIHLKNLTTLSESGAIIAPASPAFYHRPDDVDDLIEAFVGRILELAGVARLNEKFKKSI